MVNASKQNDWMRGQILSTTSSQCADRGEEGAFPYLALYWVQPDETPGEQEQTRGWA